MIWMPLYIHAIFSYLAAVGFGVFLNSPKKTLYIGGAIGMISWIIYVLLMRINFDMMSANFIAACIASLLCEILAIKMKKPTILFIVPGIITLIPGLGLYNTMSYVIEGDFQQSFTTGTNVFFSSGAIALGVIVVSSLFRTYYKKSRIRQYKERQIELKKVL